MGELVLARAEMVLYPYGLPRSDVCAHLCGRQIAALGGDFARIHDGPFPSIGRFIEHALRLRVLRHGNERPLVVLTQTNPLGLKVLQVRRDIEVALPQLRLATWVLFVDPVQDPFFLSATRILGALDGDLSEVPTWYTTHGWEFLVLSPAITDLGLLVSKAGAGRGSVRPRAGATG